MMFKELSGNALKVIAIVAMAWVGIEIAFFYRHNKNVLFC